MTLPPWMRVIQQSWLFHVVMATLVAIGGSAFACFGEKNEFSWECWKIAIIAGGVYLFASLQHSPGSIAFNPDGTPNELVKKVVQAQQTGGMVKVEVSK